VIDWLLREDEVLRIALIDNFAVSAPADRNRSDRSVEQLRSDDTCERRATYQPLAFGEGRGAPARSSLCAALRAGDVTLRPARAIMFRERERALRVSADSYDSRRHWTSASGSVWGPPNYRLERRGVDKVQGVKRSSQNLPHHCAHGFAGAAQP
jgi:hypothetical protein